MDVATIRVMAGLFFLLIMIPLYFLPSILGRKKRNFGAIFALNFLLGWTLVGWIVSLVWALSTDTQPTQVIVNQAAPPALVPVPPSLLCSACGKYSVAGSKFCHSCGTLIT